jgi:hypothetical protein
MFTSGEDTVIHKPQDGKSSENTSQPQASANAPLLFKWKLAQGSDEWEAIVNEPDESQHSKFRSTLNAVLIALIGVVRTMLIR